MTSKRIRQQFLDFFVSKGHTMVESSPVVPPADDPSLKDTFTNAGMNQFKDVFLGTGSRPYNRAANTQKCIRAGGKHNDLDDVGRDTYHHTFFEMLGNWSFGNYFKKEAIEWAWELLTGVWGIEKDRLHATYFEGDAAEGLEPDTEAQELWKTVTDIDPAHVHPGGKKDNFWEMGDTGPCGPCSEIHIDLTPDKSGGPLVNAGDPRVIELWNLVFIQFSRGSDGKLAPLPAKHVDTGLGLERLVAVLQGMHRGRIGEVSNYDTDVFTPLFDAIRKRTGAPPYGRTLPPEPHASACADPRTDDTLRPGDRSRGLKPAARDEVAAGDADGHGDGGTEQRITHEQVMIDVSYRVIADHLRCLTFALTDGAIPSNEGRGYVLRRILRRAVRYARQYMNMHEPFLCDLVQPLVQHMADAFPELRSAYGGKNVEHITKLIRDEEASFFRTLERGLRIANAIFAGARAIQRWRLPTSPRQYALALMHKTFAEASNVKLVTWGDRDELPEPEEGYKEQVFSGASFKLFDEAIDEMVLNPGVVRGREVFILYDTHGFPIDLTEQMAEEQGLTIDIEGYERLMEEARSVARRGQKLADNTMFFRIIEKVRGKVQFVGYDHLFAESEINTVLAVGEDGELTEVDSVSAGQEAWLVLAKTPFYPEQGGQVGDVGKIVGTDSDWEFEVDNTQRIGETIVHHGRCVGDLHIALPSAAKIGGPSSSYSRARVDDSRRRPTMQNHTSTHLLNWALREVLEIESSGDKVEQKGSLVDPDKTRFDFSHNKPVTADELARIESLVNEKIDADLPVYAPSREEDFVDEKEAREIDTLRAVFGEKYPDRVRVVSIGAPITEDDAKRAGQADWLLRNPKDAKWMQYAVEFCGGTHLKQTGEAERFVLTTEEGVAKGVRRVVGVSGKTARDAINLGNRLLAEAEALQEAGGARPTYAGTQGRRDKGTKNVGSAVRTNDDGTKNVGSAVRTNDDLASALSAFQQKINDATISIGVRHQLRERIAELQERAKKQQKQASSASGEAVMDSVGKFLASAETVGGVTIVVGEVPPAAPDALRSAIDWVRNKTQASAVLLATVSDDKVTLIAGMSKGAVENGLKAGDLIKEVAPLVGGRGGGRPDMAQGGGGDPSGLPTTLDRAGMWIREKLH
jgi:alanyl-tRNA synthetase